jgi:hypothetical protein
MRHHQQMLAGIRLQGIGQRRGDARTKRFQGLGTRRTVALRIRIEGTVFSFVGGNDFRGTEPLPAALPDLAETRIDR